MATVTKIPATLNKQKKSIVEQHKRRVAAYARVSTDNEEQETSFDAQVDYYTHYIQGRADWEFAGMYSDEGITATNTKRREGFNQMVEDALAGKIDLIITKSISRFARNTVDSLVTVRKLKEIGVEIYFEKENIWTLDAKGEVLITIMSSLAQEESRSISENVTWGHRKRFSDGHCSLNFTHFLGYDQGPNGEFVINPEQAETVRLIYKLFLSGLTPHAIAKEMMKRKITSPGGKPNWYQGTVESILTNEKYKGDALLQKYYTKDYLTHKQVRNTGEIPQYYVEDHHEAIIDAETFERVQKEMAKRKGMAKRYSGANIFSSKIKCGDCGSWYGSKVWHSNSKYRKVIYQCNHKFKNDCKCSTPHITEEEIKQAFVKAVNIALEEKDELIANTKVMMDMVCKTDDLKVRERELMEELDILVQQIQKLIRENSQVAINQTEYQMRYADLEKRYNAAEEECKRVTESIEETEHKETVFHQFIEILESQDGLTEEFDEGMWSNLLDFITIESKEKIIFTFKNGQEIAV